MLLTLHEKGMAKAQGVVRSHRVWFCVSAAIAGCGGLIQGGWCAAWWNAFLVIPAATAKLLSQQFSVFVLLSTGVGALSAVLGIVLSAALNLR